MVKSIDDYATIQTTVFTKCSDEAVKRTDLPREKSLQHRVQRAEEVEQRSGGLCRKDDQGYPPPVARHVGDSHIDGDNCVDEDRIAPQCRQDRDGSAQRVCYQELRGTARHLKSSSCRKS